MVGLGVAGVEPGVDAADEEGAANDVAYGGGDEVVPNHLTYADFRTCHDAGGDEEHIGNGVLVA